MFITENSPEEAKLKCLVRICQNMNMGHFQENTGQNMGIIGNMGPMSNFDR